MVQVAQDARLRIAYYCSGHGYGHATRVSAVACHLLRLKSSPAVHIVSSAPQHVFSDSIALGALYRRADIDPVIVQPVAYRVDRRKSVEVLRSFLETKATKIADEKEWLQNIEVDCVLSDAAFLGCAAANAAGIPSILITNFTFDSVYSYLSTPLVSQCDDVPTSQSADTLHARSSHHDVPIPEKELAPLVNNIIEGYRCADLLIRLPGAIPIPTFSICPSLPSTLWVDPATTTFLPEVSSHLSGAPLLYGLHPSIPFPQHYHVKPPSIPRSIISAPLVVRPPNPAVYTVEGRKKLLDMLGVPLHLQDPDATKILLVSFGGQVFHKPHSQYDSRSLSNATSPRAAGRKASDAKQHRSDSTEGLGISFGMDEMSNISVSPSHAHAEALSTALKEISLNTPPRRLEKARLPEGISQKSSTRKQSKLVVAGAPPASIPTSPTSPTAFVEAASFTSITVPPTPDSLRFERNMWEGDHASEVEDEVPKLFPDDRWIAIVCGVSKDWTGTDGEELPDNFFLAPKDVYMPDVTAVADVLLGKLGYGTVSECVDACTPFVFVPRPLFIEEFGLRLLLQQEGVGVELSRLAYESGEWATAIEEAWSKGKERKLRKRMEGETGKRKQEGAQMAETIVDWVHKWKEAY